MLWLLWLLAVPVLAGWLFLFAFCRAAAKPMPSPSFAERGSKETPIRDVTVAASCREEGWYGRIRKRPRPMATPMHLGAPLPGQAGYIEFATHMRRPRFRRSKAEDDSFYSAD